MNFLFIYLYIRFILFYQFCVHNVTFFLSPTFLTSLSMPILCFSVSFTPYSSYIFLYSSLPFVSLVVPSFLPSVSHSLAPYIVYFTVPLFLLYISSNISFHYYFITSLPYFPLYLHLSLNSLFPLPYISPLPP